MWAIIESIARVVLPVEWSANIIRARKAITSDHNNQPRPVAEAPSPGCCFDDGKRRAAHAQNALPLDHAFEASSGRKWVNKRPTMPRPTTAT